MDRTPHEKRVVSVKSGRYRDVLVRKGHYYAFPKELAESFVFDGFGFFEGDEPPLSHQLLEDVEEVYSQAPAASRRRALLEARALAKHALKLEQEDKLEAAMGRAAALRAARERAKQEKAAEVARALKAAQAAEPAPAPEPTPEVGPEEPTFEGDE